MQLGREYTNIRYTGDSISSGSLTASSGIGSTLSLHNRSSVSSASVPYNSVTSTPIMMRSDSKKTSRIPSETQLPRYVWVIDPKPYVLLFVVLTTALSLSSTSSSF